LKTGGEREKKDKEYLFQEITKKRKKAGEDCRGAALAEEKKEDHLKSERRNKKPRAIRCKEGGENKEEDHPSGGEGYRQHRAKEKRTKARGKKELEKVRLKQAKYPQGKGGKIRSPSRTEKEGPRPTGSRWRFREREQEGIAEEGKERGPTKKLAQAGNLRGKNI